MATENRGGNRSGSGHSNNPRGRNQYSGAKGTVRQNPLATAAAVGGAVAAGVFLWSRRSQVSEQIANLSDQINEWREGMAGDGYSSRADQDGSGLGLQSSGRTQTEIAQEALTLKEIGKAM